MSERAGKPNSHTKSRWRVVFWPRKIQRPIVETIIIDTPALIDTSNPSIQTHPHGAITSSELLEAASHALFETRNVTLQHVRDSLPPVHAQPSNTYMRPITGSTWHHGKYLTTYWISTAESLLQRCDLTENERERALAQVRRLSTQHKLVYAVAREINMTATVTTRDLTFLGFISTNLRMHTDLLRTIAFCSKQNIRLIYASADAETIVSAVAHATKILSQSELPSRFDLKYYRATTPSTYAHLTDTNRCKLIAQFDPSTTLVTDAPLTEIIATITVR